jgi:hypothetical protein
MTTFLTLIGFIIAVVVFLYFLQAVDSGKRALSGQNSPAARPQVPAQQERQHPASAAAAQGSWNCLPDDLKNQLPGRRCPLCSRTLTRTTPFMPPSWKQAPTVKFLFTAALLLQVNAL